MDLAAEVLRRQRVRQLVTQPLNDETADGGDGSETERRCPATGDRFTMPLDEFLQKAVRVTVPKRWFGDDVQDETSALFDEKEGGGRAGRRTRLG